VGVRVAVVHLAMNCIRLKGMMVVYREGGWSSSSNSMFGLGLGGGMDLAGMNMGGMNMAGLNGMVNNAYSSGQMMMMM